MVNITLSEDYDENDMFICYEHGTKKNSESLTGVEPVASKKPVGRSRPFFYVHM